MSMPSRNKRKERSSPEPQRQPPSEIPASSSSLDTDNLSSMTPETQTQPPSEINPASSSSVADNLSSMKPHLLDLPPGYKFVPDEQEILRYLKAYLDGDINSLLYVPIHHVNIYNSNPQQLSVEFKKGNETEWFFISERNKVAAKNGKKHKRGDNAGFWHATAKTKSINPGEGEGLVGNYRALAYYVGKPSSGVKAKWLMHEYWFDSSCDDNDNDNENENVVKKDYALYKLYVSPHVAKKEKAEEEEKQKRKKEEEAVAIANIEALLEQPSNVEYHQPQFSQALLDSYQSQFSQCLLESYQPIVHQQQQQFCSDSYQPQAHDISYQQQQSRMILPPPPQGQDSRSEMVMTTQSQSQSSQVMLDSYQPHQSQSSQVMLDSYQPHQSQSSQAHLDSFQSHQPQFSQALLDSYEPQSSQALVAWSDIERPRRFVYIP